MRSLKASILIILSRHLIFYFTIRCAMEFLKIVYKCKNGLAAFETMTGWKYR